MSKAQLQVVVRLPNWVGDACMALPALQWLQAQGAQLLMVGKPWAKDLFAGHGWPHLSLVGNTDVQRLRTHLQQFAFQDTNHRVVGLVLPNSFSSAWLFKRAGLGVAGARGQLRSLLLDPALERPDTHEANVFFSLAQQAWQYWTGVAIATNPAPRNVHLQVSPQAHADVQQQLAHAGVTGSFVLLAPIATGLINGEPKEWPHFQALGQQLKNAGVQVITCAPPNEIERTRAVLPDAMHLSSMPLDRFAALCAAARCVVANDSGTSHVAAASGAQVITLIGVTNPARTAPWSDACTVLGSMGQWPGVDTVWSHLNTILGSVR